MVNDFGGLLINLKPFREYDDAIKFYKQIFENLKSSLMPFGVVMTTRLAMMLPYALPKFLVNDLTDKYSIVFSNVCTAKGEMIWNGKKMESHFVIPPGVGKLYSGISLNSIGPRSTLTVFSDKVMLRDPQLLVDIMTRKNDEILGGRKNAAK